MSSLTVAFVVFSCCAGSALVGMVLHRKLPRDHLDGDSKDVVRLVMGLIATMAALVLGLLIASAKASYDTQATEMQQLGAQIAQIDRMLVIYGPETKEIRGSLRQGLADAHDRIWPADKAQPGNIDPATDRGLVDALYDKLVRLSPRSEAQTRAQNTALQLASGVVHTRMLMFEQLGDTVAWPLLTVLIFWVSVLFLGFGLFARFHMTVAVALAVGAISVAGAIFLIMELNQPYHGLIRIPDTAFRNALAHMDQ